MMPSSTSIAPTPQQFENIVININQQLIARQFTNMHTAGIAQEDRFFR